MLKKTARVFHIGLDDTDSSEGMCTTFLTFNLALRLTQLHSRLLDFPNLIRLNPNIPWKTRGNASLVLRVETTLETDEVSIVCKRMVDRYATSQKANSGLVILEGEEIPPEVLSFGKSALHKVMSLSAARELLDSVGATYYGKRTMQGLIGALAGIGNKLQPDYTFELIAYRRNCAMPRKIERSKIIEMDRATKPLTFNCYDAENDRVLIMPHGPDPVLLGIRGESSQCVKRAFEMLLPIKNLLGYMIFRSNQGTGEHLSNHLCLAEIKAYSSGKVRGFVSNRPKPSLGGHVFFTLINDEGKIPCAAYEPTGRFRKDILALKEGDLIEVGGGVRKGTILHPKILNLEYMIPRKLVRLFESRIPKCSNCSGRMSSEGREKGYECVRCGFRAPNLEKSMIMKDRELIEDKLYLPDLKAHRHLTKPLQRYSINHGMRNLTNFRPMPSFYPIGSFLGRRRLAVLSRV